MTVVVMFTRATQPFEREALMDGEHIPYSNTVVYLGVTLDHKLLWSPHIDNKVKKAKTLLAKLANIINSYWGPKPKLLRLVWYGQTSHILWSKVLGS